MNSSTTIHQIAAPEQAMRAQQQQPAAMLIADLKFAIDMGFVVWQRGCVGILLLPVFLHFVLFLCCCAGHQYLYTFPMHNFSITIFSLQFTAAAADLDPFRN